MPITDRVEVAIITGASSGLGAGLARELASRGVRVGLTARREPELRALAAEIQARGGVAAVAPADAADPGATRAALASLAQALGPIDLLVANAGIDGAGASGPGFSAGAFERLLRVNLLGAAHAVEAVLPAMIGRRRGHLVAMSSLAGLRGFPGTAGYSASKAALSTLFEGLRHDLRPLGIAVTVVHPGFVRTPMTEASGRRQPFRIEVEPAARIIARGIAARRREINFPRSASLLMHLIAGLPGPLFDRLAASSKTARPGRRAGAGEVPSAAPGSDDADGREARGVIRDDPEA